MTNILDLTGKLEPSQLEVFSELEEITSELDVPYLVIGATARDLVMHYGYGVRIKRATVDLDYAISIPGWEKYEELSTALQEIGFTRHAALYRFTSPMGAILDLVPFGGVENTEAFIEWPPDGDIIMNMLGFEEALTHAQQVKVHNAPELTINVASPVGLALLKTIAWADRTMDKRTKDASDILLLLKSYEDVPGVFERMYGDHSDILDEYGYDQRITSAYILGFDVGSITSPASKVFIQGLVAGRIDGVNPEILAEEMSSLFGDDLETNQKLVSAFFAGFNSV